MVVRWTISEFAFILSVYHVDFFTMSSVNILKTCYFVQFYIFLHTTNRFIPTTVCLNFAFGKGVQWILKHKINIKVTCQKGLCAHRVSCGVWYSIMLIFIFYKEYIMILLYTNQPPHLYYKGDGKQCWLYIWNINWHWIVLFVWKWILNFAVILLRIQNLVFDIKWIDVDVASFCIWLHIVADHNIISLVIKFCLHYIKLSRLIYKIEYRINSKSQWFRLKLYPSYKLSDLQFIQL